MHASVIHFLIFPIITAIDMFILGLYKISFSNTDGAGLGRFRNSNPGRAGFGENLFLDLRTIRLMKLMASTVLLAATVQCFFCYICLPVFSFMCNDNEFCIRARIVDFF